MNKFRTNIFLIRTTSNQLLLSRQKLSTFSENKVLQKLKFSKNVNNVRCAYKMIFFNEKKNQKDSDNFRNKKLTTFSQKVLESTNFSDMQFLWDNNLTCFLPKDIFTFFHKFFRFSLFQWGNSLHVTVLKHQQGGSLLLNLFFSRKKLLKALDKKSNFGEIKKAPLAQQPYLCTHPGDVWVLDLLAHRCRAC